MNNLKPLIFSLFIMLSACSTMDGLKSFATAYHEPPNPTSSRLRVITNQTVRLVPDSTCIDWSLPGVGMVNSRALALANDRKFNDRVLGMPGGDGAKNSSEVYVYPDKPIILAYSGVSPNQRYQCFTAVYFIPEAGADYESNSEMCHISVEKIIKSEGSGEISREAVAHSEAKICSR